MAEPKTRARKRSRTSSRRRVSTGQAPIRERSAGLRRTQQLAAHDSTRGTSATSESAVHQSSDLMVSDTCPVVQCDLSPTGDNNETTVADDNDSHEWPVEREDKIWALNRLHEKRMTRAALAREVGMTRQNMYLLLDPDGGAKRSALWPRIVEVLGGTPPSGIPAVLDERLREIQLRWNELTEQDKILIEELARRLSRRS